MHKFWALRGSRSNHKNAKIISANKGYSFYEKRNRRWTRMNADLLHGHISRSSGCFYLRRRARIRGHHRKARRVRKVPAAVCAGVHGGELRAWRRGGAVLIKRIRWAREGMVRFMERGTVVWH
ncbi:MAG: hypothetical protein O8C64_02885 [Candidatus Methanoperedens sp.]|nr:hypothetical protein [Candidatus Methanoperedens sp.]